MVVLRTDATQREFSFDAGGLDFSTRMGAGNNDPQQVVLPQKQSSTGKADGPGNVLVANATNTLTWPDVKNATVWLGTKVDLSQFPGKSGPLNLGLSQIGVNSATAYWVTNPGGIAQNVMDPEGASKRADPNTLFFSFGLDPKVMNAIGVAEILKTAFGDGPMIHAARGAMLVAFPQIKKYLESIKGAGLTGLPLISVAAPLGTTVDMLTGRSPKVDSGSPLPAAAFGIGLILFAPTDKKAGATGNGSGIFLTLGEVPNPKADNNPASVYSMTIGTFAGGVKFHDRMPDSIVGASIPMKIMRVNDGEWKYANADGTLGSVPKEVARALNALTGQNAPILENTVSIPEFLERTGLPPEAMETFAKTFAPIASEALQLGTMFSAAGSLPVPFGVFPLVGYLINKGQQLDEAMMGKIAEQFIAQGGLSPSKLAAQLPAEMSTPELTAAANLLSKAIDLHLERNPGDREKLKDIWSAAANGKDTRLAYLGKIVTGDLRGAAELAILRGDPLAHIDAISPLKGLASSLAPDQRIEGYAGAQTPRGDYAQVAVGILPEKAAFAMLSPPGRNLPPVELSGSTLAEAQQEARRLIEKEEGDIANYYQSIPGKPPLGTPAPAENFLDRPTTVSHRPAVVLGLGTMKVVEDTTNGRFFAVGKAGQPYPVEPARYPDEAIATAQQMMLDGRIPKDDIIPQN